ncbi:MAG: hypothetical protein IPH03_03760 [Tetrasphaera sp.]|nr:hypothetical protein [Tetrasphaera sp.]
MRTTLDLDEQVLAVARSLGDVPADLAMADFAYSPFPVIVGDSDVLVSDELIAELRDA